MLAEPVQEVDMLSALQIQMHISIAAPFSFATRRISGAGLTNAREALNQGPLVRVLQQVALEFPEAPASSWSRLVKALDFMNTTL
jgi:hypothetical protein